MQMEKSGLVKYFLNLQGLEHSNVTSIQIDNGRKSQRLLRIAHELGPMQVTKIAIGHFGTFKFKLHFLRTHNG